MNLADLIREGEHLAKPSLVLTEQPANNPIVAYWGGTGRTDLPARARSFSNNEHRITLDCGWLAKHGVRLTGSLSVYVSPTNERGSVYYDAATPFSSASVDGLPLYGVEQPSFPPIQAVCLYGSAAVEQWIHTLGLTRYDYDTIESTELGQQYQQEWINRSPFYNGTYAAVIGGWHMQWPEDDFYMPREMRLVAWTFRDAEPWIEVWERLPNFRVNLRTT